MKKRVLLAVSLTLFNINTNALSLWNHILLRTFPDSLLLKAIENKDKESLIRCIGKANFKEFTPVYNAALNHDFKTLKFLIRNGADINVKDYDNGYTVLHYAAELGDFNLVKELISLGADSKASNKHGITPFNRAKDNKHEEICNLLIENGAYNLLEAARCGDMEGVIRFLPKDLNIKTENKFTALHMAALHGHKEIIDVLIKNGADINAQDNNGWTPLYVAISQFQEKDVIELLLQKGADLTLLLEDGSTFLHFAVTFHNIDIIKLLVEAKIPVNARRRDGDTALGYAKGIKFFPDMDKIIDYLKSVGGIE